MAAALGLVLATVSVAAGCGGTAEAFALPGAPAVSLADADLGLWPGETMAFEVKLGGLQVGEAALAVGEPGDYQGKRAITVRSKIGTTGAVRLVRPVDDEATTVIEVGTGAPLHLQSHVLMNGQETFTTATFTPGKALVEVRRTGAPTPAPYAFTFDDLPTHDAHSAMADLRGWRPAPGATRTVWLVGGRRLWRIDLTYVGIEQLGTAQGNRAASRLHGIGYRVHPDRKVDDRRPPRHFTVWMSDDADRVPLRVTALTELGEVQIDLADYQRP
ncbi:MAG: DUF3108 domain-containing protein [Myxococcales bacterium]|nr:DUF3108 domain-containing protein [Myxococcales bacterium]